MAQKSSEELEKELAALKQEFEDFAYIVSHDLSGPLRHAAGFAEMVLANKNNALEDKSRRHLTFIMSSAEKGRHSLELLRTYSRLNTREYPLLDGVEMNDVIEAALAAHQEKIVATNAVITVPDLPVIKCAPDLMQRACIYLLDNALTYRAASIPPVIQIKYEETGTHYVFAIEDQGIGIVETRKDDIFKIFKRAVEQEEYPGDGMGLTLANKIAQKHNGALTLETRLGEGSTFYFSVSKYL